MVENREVDLLTSLLTTFYFPVLTLKNNFKKRIHLTLFIPFLRTRINLDAPKNLLRVMYTIILY